VVSQNSDIHSSVHVLINVRNCSTDISRLRSNLLRNYDSNSRPVQSHRTATEVEFYIYNHGFEFVSSIVHLMTYQTSLIV
jgi:hypothetical protein